jgi:hypothetical protein
MGLIERIFGGLFGGGRNIVAETAEVFRENAEQRAVRDTGLRAQAMREHGIEFNRWQKGAFDRFMDGVNRLPRPALALGTLGLFVSAMFDPVWFASRMQGIALVPEPLWWLLGAIVSFYFGARHQVKGQEFRQTIARTMAQVPMVVENLQTLDRYGQDYRRGGESALVVGPGAVGGNPEPNAALQDWKRQSG